MNQHPLDRGQRITTALAYAVPGSTPGSQVRDDIQWMPPGEQTVTPTVGGEPRELTIQVDAALAEKFARQFRVLMAAADAGTGDYPYFDYNHEFGAASGHPIEFYWGGPDPLTGGIRAKVQWTAAARAALEDRQFRRFSPHWLVDADTGAPVALSPNLGGLVNLAAFETIQSVRATKPGPAHKNQMTTDEIKAAVTAALAPLAARLDTLEAAAVPQTSATAAAAVPAETLARITSLEAAAAAAKQTHAQQMVKGAQAAGQLAPQDKEAEAFWVSAIAAQGAAAEAVLRGLPKNSALARMVTAGANGGAAGAVPAQAGAAVETAAGFVETFRVEAAKAGATRTVAIQSAIAANKSGYAAWRAANGQPGL